MKDENFGTNFILRGIGSRIKRKKDVAPKAQGQPSLGFPPANKLPPTYNDLKTFHRAQVSAGGAFPSGEMVQTGRIRHEL